MSTIRRRLADIEERRAFRDWQEVQRQFEGRSQDELQFFVVYGYFPDSLEGQLPRRQEFTVGYIRTVITAERVEPGSQRIDSLGVRSYHHHATSNLRLG